MLRLPFRFRTGKLYRFQVTGENPFEVWILNRFLIPEDSDHNDWLPRLHATGINGYSPLWSEAIVFVPDPHVSEEVIDALRKGEAKIPSEKNLFRTQAAFNEFICAYATAANNLFGGAPLRMLTDMEFFDSLYVEAAFLSPPGYDITSKDIDGMFSWKPEREFVKIGGQLSGGLADLPATTLATVGQAHQNFREHAFYEIAFKAKTEMVGLDPIVAIILASAALEGVHAELLRRATKGKISDGLMSKMLREQGIHTLIQITPRLFMPEDERPNDETIRRCVDALEKRNAIIHAKMSGGRYKMRGYTFDVLSNAYSAVMEMYNSLLKFVSR